MVRHCLVIRNQFAHCNWGDDPNGSDLFFADVQASASSDSGELCHSWRHVNIELLNAQEAYFSNTLEWFDYLDHEMRTLQGRLDRNHWPMPPVLPRPPLHNPPEEHVPPWLSEAGKALHLARALASKGGPPTPTHKQQAQEKVRAEKRGKQEENIRRSREGEDRAKARSSPPDC
jgi:hypothetical protein